MGRNSRPSNTLVPECQKAKLIDGFFPLFSNAFALVECFRLLLGENVSRPSGFSTKRWLFKSRSLVAMPCRVTKCIEAY
jgi:hypothetical protein